MSVWLRARLVIDRVIAAVLLVALSPVIGVAALLIRLQDSRPAFIQVRRIGRGGVEFGMWKLRTMRAETAGGLASGVGLTTAEDVRITPIGAKLRAYYLDELPQLVNVVKGEMSLLGPRPEAPEYVDLDDPMWAMVLAVPPGIAGPTQLIVNDWERRVITEFPDGSAYHRKVVPVKLALDLWYLRRSSPRFDLMVASTLLRRFVPGPKSRALRLLALAEVPESAVVD